MNAYNTGDRVRHIITGTIFTVKANTPATAVQIAVRRVADGTSFVLDAKNVEPYTSAESIAARS